MTARQLGGALLLALTALASGVAVLPASWLPSLLPASAPLALVAPRGSIWAGEAMLAVGTAGRQRTLPDAVRWRAGLLPRPHLTLTHPWLAGPLRVEPGWRGAQVSAQRLRLPASVLATLHATLMMLGPEGDLLLAWPDWPAAARDGAPYQWEAVWRDAASARASIRPMGEYRLSVSHAPGQPAALTLATLKGPLALAGSGRLGQGQLQFDGTAHVQSSASGDTHEAFRELLAALGPRIEQQTRFRLQ